MVVLVLVAAFVGLTQLYTDVLWYDQLGYLSVFVTENVTKIVIFVVAAVLVAALMFASLFLAYRSRPITAESIVDDNLRRYQEALEPVRKIVIVVVPVLFGLFAASTAMTQWDTVLLFLNQEPFGQEDPQFGLDIGF